MNHPLSLRALFKALPLALLLALSSEVKAVTALKIDLTAGNNLSTVDRTYTYNLGATGMRGWIDNGWPETPAQDGYTAFAPYQILVTAVGAGTPAAASGLLAVNDVILGASAGSGAVPLFTSDARKSLGVAIGAAEAANGILSFKRWRAGTTTDVSITLPVMGAYTDTAPYNCSKTTLIMKKAAKSLAKRIKTNGWGVDGPGSINALALLATPNNPTDPTNPDDPGDPNNININYLPMLQTYARSIAPATLDLERSPIDAWSCYQSVFLAEYYMLTNDAEVFHGLSEYVIYAAKHTSMYGTAGHGFSNVPPPGGWEAGGTNGLCSWYGPVNQAGLVAQLTVALGKKAGVVSPAIDPAIARAANFFGYYVNRGSIPYGEHQPYYGEHQLQGQSRTYYDHCSNGKDGLAAVMFACMDNKPVQTEYFSRMALAGYNGEAYGHTGQGFSYLWTMLGANMGGQLAVAEYHKKMRWDRDMKRRSDGSFVYEGGEQWAPGKSTDYWDAPQADGGPNIYYDNPTAYYLIHACIPLKKLYITGKNANPVNNLSAAAVSNATWAAQFTAACGAYTKAQLFSALGEWDPIVRYNAATELATRSLTPTEVTSLITMAENPTDANQREAACTALGCLQATSAIPALTRRLKDTDIWVRAKAAKALTAMGAAATPYVPAMLDAFVTNVKPTYPFEAGFNWDDPLQIPNGYLSETLFYHLGTTTINADKSLLYPAVRAGIKQPAGMWRGQLSDFVQNLLTLEDVKALAPDLFEEVTLEGPCDRMFTMAGPYMALSALSKYHIAEGIDLAMGKTSFWGWDAAAAFDFLKPYDESARRMLPDLHAQDLAWMSATDPVGGENAANLDACIARIEAATTAPDLIYGLAVANPQIGVTPANTAKAVTLTGSSCRQATVICALASQPLHGTLTGTPPALTYTPAAGYQGMDRFTFTTTDGLTTSAPATVHLVVGTGGSGLNGSYYDNMDFTLLKATRIDPSVNFDWGTAPPATLGAGTYSVRWTGQVMAPESGTYRFSTRTSDGVRLWVNGVQVVNDWNDQVTSLWNDSAPITLTAGQKYSLKMEYYDNANPSTARLYWYMPSRKAATIIPQELLFPVTGVVLTSPSNGSSFAPGTTVALTADVSDVAGTVTNVSFYQGTTLIGSDTTAPYAVNWTNVATGEYSLTSKATTSTGAVSTSTVVVITVGGNAVPVTSGLACWFDSSYGVTADADQQVTFWHDRSGNGHDAVFELWEKPVVMRNQLFSKPAIRFSDKAAGFFDLAGTLFVKEQYVVVRSPSYATWSSYGGFLCHRSGRGSSYLLGGSGFESAPAAVSKNGTALTSPFNLGTITNFMVLKITVDNSNTSPAAYQIGRSDGYSCEFDVTEILGYSRPLTSQEQAKVGGYLTAKYGLTTTYPSTGSLANRAATGITNSSAVINATLMCNGTNYDVTAYWGPEDGGINPTNWANSVSIGSWTNVASIDLNRTLTNLAPGTTYYYTFRATNATSTIWATPAQSFTTLSTAKDMLTFGANVAGSSAVIDTVTGTVAWTVPYGTVLTNLAAAYTASPLAAGSPASGISRNFTTPQTYIMTAQDGSTKTYTVTAILGAASPACDMLTFGPGATIDGNYIYLTVPYETDLATLAPTYTVSTGASGIPASGVAPNFAIANPATYTITGQDGITTKTYYVTLTVLPFNPNRITNGSFEVGRDFAGAAYTAVNPGTADLPGWTGPASFSWYINGPVWGTPAQDGTRFMNLVYTTGTYPLSQSFAVSAGTVYTVSYYERIRGNGYMDATLSVAAGTVTGASGLPVAVSAGPAASIVQTTAVNAAWTRHTFTFTPNTTTTATITLGNHYDGTGGDNDGVFLDNVSVTATVIVGPRVSTTTLTRHPGTGTSSPYGTALSFDVTVAGNFGTPVGTVTLKDGGSGGTTLGSATLTSGACTITTPTLAVGTHTNIVAVYGGNSTYATSTSSPLSTQTVNPSAANTAPVATAQSVTTAEDTAKAITLAGTDAEGNPLTYATVTQPAHGTLSGTPPNVTYTPATNYNGADSFTFKANDGLLDSAPATVTITVTAVNDEPVVTTTTLATLTPSTYGNPVIFTATVAPAPTGGTLQFFDNTVALGSPVAVNPGTGVAQYTTNALTAGSHAITATFSGTTGFSGSSTAGPITQTVNPATPVVAVSGTTSFTYNTSAQGPNTATTGGSTGAVTFSYAGTGGTTYPASGTPPTNAGSYTCTATVAADTNYTSASSGAMPFTIAKASPVITWNTPAPIIVGTALGVTQLNATSDGVAGNFVYTPASGVVLAEGSHILSTQFTPAVTANYNIPAATTVTIQVNPLASLAITDAQWSGAGNHYGVSTTDLINAGQATLASIAFAGTANWGSSVGKLNDGSEGGGGTNNGECLAPVDGGVVTVVLDTSVNTFGYDLASIITLTGCADNESDRISQKYDVAYHVVGGAPGAWTTLAGDAGATVARSWTSTSGPGETYGGEMKATISGMNLTGVDQLRFTFHNAPPQNTISLYKEIDVFGTATVGVSNTYDSWAAAQVPPVTGGPNGDSNHDGVQNGIAYFMNDTGPITHPGLNAGNMVTWTNGGKIPKTEYGTRFVVQTSTTLEHWDDVPVDDTKLSNFDDSVSYTLPAGAGKVFVRLVVTP